MASESEQPGAGPAQAPAGGAPGDGSRSSHGRSFKLRFASQREQGRSYVSLVKPLGLPDTVTGKFYCRSQPSRVDEEGTRGALQRIRDMFERGPREKYAAPVTSAQVWVQVRLARATSLRRVQRVFLRRYGWHAEGEDAARARGDRRLSHHVRDSAWLRARLAVLAADDRLKQR